MDCPTKIRICFLIVFTYMHTYLRTETFQYNYYRYYKKRFFVLLSFFFFFFQKFRFAFSFNFLWKIFSPINFLPLLNLSMFINFACRRRSNATKCTFDPSKFFFFRCIRTSRAKDPRRMERQREQKICIVYKLEDDDFNCRGLF